MCHYTKDGLAKLPVRFRREDIIRPRSIIVIINVGKEKKKANYCSLRNAHIQISNTLFFLFRLTNDAVAEGWLVRGYRDTRGKFDVKLRGRNINIY